MLNNIKKHIITDNLAWYESMGVDENIQDTPRNRFDAIKTQPLTLKVDLPLPKSNVELPKNAPTIQNIPTTSKKPIVTSEPLPDLSSITTIDAITEVIKNFNGHPLKKLATNTVVYDGNPLAKIMVIGEAPGDNEDKQGIPFVGISGQLMRKMMQFANINDYFITNTIFWRPPANRTPTLDEINICYPFLEKIINIIQPKIIITLGYTATSTILKDTVKEKTMANVRGVWYNVDMLFGKTLVMPTYHPSYLLRVPKKKKETWNDFLEVYENI